MTTMVEIEAPSVASIAAGLHDDGETVAITGVLNGRTVMMTSQGNEWAMFELIGDRTAIQVLVFPTVYSDAGAVLGPVREPDGTLRPPTVTVTGEVDCRDLRPVLIVKQIARSEAGETFR